MSKKISIEIWKLIIRLEGKPCGWPEFCSNAEYYPKPPCCLCEYVLDCVKKWIAHVPPNPYSCKKWGRRYGTSLWCDKIIQKYKEVMKINEEKSRRNLG